MRKFQIGDAVRLKSDTSENMLMTVRGYIVDIPLYTMAVTQGLYDEHMVECDWRDAKNNPLKEAYHEDMLEKIK